ncbi:MAG TPA: hypothetical protein VLT58_09155 [Polyangia bacterium]|nr:hypothetical protein [Polyangia bacterium]
MRTTIDLPDGLYARVRRFADATGRTLRDLTIEALEKALRDAARKPRFRLRDGSWGHGGLVDGLDETDWDRIRDLTYEGRGG